MEASTPVHHGVKKRALELARPEFMAREDGAYHVLEMPKRSRCDYMANPRRARSHLLSNAKADDASQQEKKRALELDKPEFVAEDDGAYDIVEMPKKFKCNYMADSYRASSALLSAVDADDARSIARHLRIMSMSRDYIQELKAKAAARNCS